jgi:hypothetical protein
MASTSRNGEYFEISLADGGCDDNQPLSACYAYDLISNARHLRDESTQYRANWIGGQHISTESVDAYTDYIEVVGTTATYQHVLTYVFPWQVTPKEGGPRTPVLRMLASAKTTGNTFFVSSIMTPYKHDIGVGEDAGLLGDGFAWEWNGDHSSESIASIIATAGDDKTADKLFYLDILANANIQVNSWDLDTDGTSQMYKVNMSLFRLSVYAKGDGILYGLSLREYAE